jgi:uncharacterized protein (DUF2461 family)
MLVLYEHSEKRLVDRLKMEAGFHGVKIETPSEPLDQTIGRCISGDPDSYNHLSDEERKELTKKMMGKHKFWNSNDNPMGETKG